MKKIFRALKIQGQWIPVMKGHWISEDIEHKFENIWDCVEFCIEMNKQIASNSYNPNQMELFK